MSDALLDVMDEFSGREHPIPLGMLAELTHRCPLQCPYCSNPVALERPTNELSAEEWAVVFQDAAALGALQIHVSGGEPLVRRDAEDIIASAREAGLYVNLITAAVGLTQARMDSLKAAGVDHVQVSMQDADAAGCDFISGMRGAFEKKRAACEIVVENDLPLTLNSVVHRHNINNVQKMIDLALSVGAHRIEIANTQYYGWALANRANLMPTRAQVERASKIVDDARVDLRGKLLIDYVLPDYYARFPKPCVGGWGRELIAVTPSGDVLPCHAAANIPGMTFENVRERSLVDIWRWSDAFNRFRSTDELRGPCRTCDRRDEDFGGCRCQAMQLTGDPLNTDPVCVKSMHRHLIDAVLADAEASSDASRPQIEWRRFPKKTKPKAEPREERTPATVV